LMPRLDRLALEMNQPPMVLSFFPAGDGGEPLPAMLTLDGDPSVVLSSLRVSDTEEGTWIARLYESAGSAASTRIIAPALGIDAQLSFTPFEVKTLSLSRAGQITEVSLLA